MLTRPADLSKVATPLEQAAEVATSANVFPGYQREAPRVRCELPGDASAYPQRTSNRPHVHTIEGGHTVPR